MIIERKLPDFDTVTNTPVQSNIISGYWKAFYTLPSGRMLAGSDYNNGIWYSDDNGKTWVQSDLTSGSWYNFCVTQTGRVIVVGALDIAYSDDNGEHWTSSGLSGGAWYALCISHTGRVFAAGDDILYSDDNGEHWTSCNTEKTWQSICVTHSGRIIVGSGGNLQLSYGVWQSDDNGATWSQNAVLNNGIWAALCVTPTGRILTCYGLYSDDDGDTWSQSQSDVTDNWQYFYIIPGQNIIVANYYYSTDNGTSWEELTYLFDDGIYRICTAKDNTIIIGSDNGIWYVDPIIQMEETKFLDKKGVRELVTQAKQYIDNL